jgi:hypothetical protein
MDAPSWSLLIAAASLAFVLLEKTFGGGNKLANMFSKLQSETVAAVSQVRTDMSEKIDLNRDQFQVGYNKLQADLHIVERAQLELRAKIAEEYIPKGGLQEMKADMHKEFDKMDQRIGELRDLVMSRSINS